MLLGMVTLFEAKISQEIKKDERSWQDLQGGDLQTRSFERPGYSRSNQSTIHARCGGAYNSNRACAYLTWVVVRAFF
jgi:hypothetical protein